MRQVILYISCSIDGYIAQVNDDLSFLNIVAQEGEDYGYNSFISSVDTVILGKRTYDWVTKATGEYHHLDKESYVITHRELPKEGNVHFYNGDISELIMSLKKKQGANIFCDGGAQIVHALLNERLIDEVIISFIPILLGGGIKLFNEGFPLQNLKLLSSKNYPSGLVQLHYSILK
ncbi:dihydrofolate reductase family protein [Myroides injenensis]|uniref:dihydrofolate reductase family protein n=1 Tax=Myroides injenensis TaxID=1183151 RepID=UPI0002899088|nr:dihydrofolate reductase family protein [Myroides injenensis]